MNEAWSRDSTVPMTPWSIQLTTVVIPAHSSPAIAFLYTRKSEDKRKQTEYRRGESEI